MDELQRWLLDELNDRNLSAREASLGAGLHHGAISYYLGGRRPSTENCKKLARFFNVPEEMVLMLAGYMAKPPEYDQFVAQMNKLTEGWTDEQKEQLVQMVRGLLKQMKDLPAREPVEQD